MSCGSRCVWRPVSLHAFHTAHAPCSPGSNGQEGSRAPHPRTNAFRAKEDTHSDPFSGPGEVVVACLGLLCLALRPLRSLLLEACPGTLGC